MNYVVYLWDEIFNVVPGGNDDLLLLLAAVVDAPRVATLVVVGAILSSCTSD